jgi:NADPH-dependent 2,4-dienoyl-CoA reductase/sulfur reductase-like enzyme
MKRIAIIGASLAGLRAAESLRKAGFSGELTLVGAEPHLPYDRPPLSKQVLTGAFSPEQTFFRQKLGYGALALDLRLGVRATALDAARRVVTLADGSALDCDGLIIATGARVRTLPEMPELAGLHVLRGLDDARRLRDDLANARRVAVVGAGWIGLEVAASCRARGLEVTAIEALDVPLSPALGETIGRAVVALHQERGVTLRTGAKVAGIVGRDRVEAVEIADGSRIEADVVVVGIGVVPNVEWLRGSGLTLDDGVVCDSHCMAAPSIYAAGDCARWQNPWCNESMRVEHWTHASEQGHAAAQNLLAPENEQVPFASAPYVWSDQYDRKIQFAGIARGHDAFRVVAGSLAELKLTALYGRAGRLVGVLAINQPRQLIHFRRMLVDGVGFETAAATGAA